MSPYRQVSRSRAEWENKINSSFARVGSTERVCAHSDMTVNRTMLAVTAECDYCSDFIFTRNRSLIPVMPPRYYRNDDL